MKSVTLAIAALGLAAAPAFAATMTVEFAGDDGETQAWSFDDATSTATGPDGSTTSYTWDEAAKTLCAATEEGDLCATFEEAGSAVGDSSAYTANNGSSGTATITAIAE